MEDSGYDECWGDQKGPRHEMFRVVYNNVNGLQVGDFLMSRVKNRIESKEKNTLTGAKMITKVNGVISVLDRWEANVVCCAETQTAWEKCHVRQCVEAELRKQDQYATMIGSSSDIHTCEAYKPGGTLTIVDGNWSSRITKHVDSHKLGRWSYVTIKGRDDSHFTIITAYRCCSGQTKKSVGAHSSYMQQETLLRKAGNTKSPQEAFIVDLTSLLKQLLEKGHEILLCIDANEIWDRPGSRIQHMATILGLFDAAKQRHGEPVPATYRRVNCARRIDYMLCTQGVMDNMTAIGIMDECYDPVLGDHKPQFLDINIKGMLNLNIYDVCSPTSRRLKSSHPKNVKVYLKKLEENFVNHNVFSRVEELWQELENKIIMTPTQVSKYNAIDRDIYRLCKNAEYEIRPRKVTKYAWSPSLDAAVYAVQYWKQRKKWWGVVTKTRTLLHQGGKHGLSDDGTLSKTDIDAEIGHALGKLKDIQSKDCEKRVSFLEEMAEKYAAENKIDKATAIRELMHHEDIREMYRTIRLKIKGARAPQMSEVWTFSDDNAKVVLSDPDKVEQHLLERNFNQLRQAGPTPFADGELGDLLHYDGTGDIANKIVNGEDIPELIGMKDMVQRYIRGMAVQDKSVLNTVDVGISLEQYRDFWKNKRETTVTSPFGLHIGHFRSALHADVSDILDVHRIMLVLPFRFAMIPDRWARTVQILLEKDPGSPWTHRLRIIELFDSQVNAGLQIIFGKRMIQNSLKHNLLHDSTYGSIPARTAQDAVLEKTFSMDIMRVNKMTGAIFDCDAKGCYDRIIAALQSVTCRRLGMPRTTSLFFARFWKVCHHFVRTRHGTSANSYGSTSTSPLYGIGQGNGAGPAFWLSNLIVMFSVLDTVCHGMKFRSPWKKRKHKSTGMGYVDDVTLGCTARSYDVKNDDVLEEIPHEEASVMRDIGTMSHNWEEMLFTNGGLLELKKCYWLLISWKWVKGVAALKTVEEVHGELRLVQSQGGGSHIIPRKSVNDAPRVLGCHVAGNGSWKTEVGKWISEGARFARLVKRSKFNRVCGSKVYNTIWLPKLRYISPVVGFTESDSSKINNRVVFRCLQASGYNCRFAREIVHGPIQYGGMAWENCHSLQILEKIKFLLTHIRRNDKIGNLLQILIECVQIQSGLSESVLETRINWALWVETTWLSFLKQGLDAINGSIITNCAVPRQQRKFDRSLMEIFVSWGLKKKELEALNRCRIYLQVIFVSDIATYRGNSVMQDAREVQQFRPSALQWPRQVRPILADRKVWVKYIDKLCFHNNNLITPLGTWVGPTHQVWRYMLSKDRFYLLRYDDGKQKQINPIGGGKFVKHGTDTSDLKGGFPVPCTVTSTGYRVDQDLFRFEDFPTIRRRRLVPSDKSHRETLGQLFCNCLSSLEDLWMRGSDWKIATDGGYKDGIGTCSTVLWNLETEKEMCSSMSAEYCDFHLLHSTREELRGNLSAEILMNECNMLFGSEGNNEVNFICDSKSALKQVDGDVNKLASTKPLGAEMELILEIGRLRNLNKKIRRNFTWVRSHQEEKTLTENEKLNDRADELATECRDDVISGLGRQTKKQVYKGSLATLTINNCVINKNYKEAVQNALFAEEMKSYLMEKYAWSEEIFNSIHWDILGDALKCKQGIQRVTVHKLIHRWQPTNRYVQRNQRRRPNTAMCTECGEIDGQLHYMECKSDYFTEARSFAWVKFCNKMKAYKSEATLLRVIWIGIQNWIYRDFDGDLPCGEEINAEEYRLLTHAYESQNEIGWDHFITGKVSKKWSAFYALRVPESMEKEGKVLAFGRTLVDSIWSYTLDVWRAHNEAVHGKKNRHSKRDVESLRSCVAEIYNLQSLVSTEDEWLFRIEVRRRKEQPVQQIVGWLQRVLVCFNEQEKKTYRTINVATQVITRLCSATIYS